MIITFPDILEPIGGLIAFENDFRGKKFFVVRFEDNPMSDHFSWTEFNQYMNGYNEDKRLSRVARLHIVREDGNLWCNETSSYSLPHRRNLSNRWSAGHTMILPVFDTWSETLYNQTREIEYYYGPGVCDIYCSPRKDCTHLPPRHERKDQFFFHVDGEIRWTIYKQFFDLRGDEDLEPVAKFDLKPGDILYIPKGQYFKMYPLGRSLTAAYVLNESNKKVKQRPPYFKFEKD